MESNIKTILNQITSQMKKLCDDKFDWDFKFKKNWDIEFYTGEDYYKFQDEGVKGTKRGRSSSGYSFNKKMPPPSSFSKYTTDKDAQFAIAVSIKQEGIEAQHYTDKILKDTKIQSLIADLYAELTEEYI